MNGDGSWFGPLVLFPKRRWIVHAVRNYALMPGLAPIWDSGCVWCSWPYSVGILVKVVAFLGSLHWPAAGADLVVGGVSYVELLILQQFWAGERLVLLFPAIDGLDVQFQCQLFRLVQAL